MSDKFLESVKAGFLSQIEEIINRAKRLAEKDNLNAIDTLVLVNNNINSWISSINGIIHIDDELLTKVAYLKRPFVTAAKKEVAFEVSKIIENESSDVTSKINDFMNELKKKGIDLDGKKESKKDVKKEEEILKKTPRRIEPTISQSERIFGGRQRALKRESEPSRRSTSNDCPPDSCGGGGGCGC